MTTLRVGCMSDLVQSQTVYRLSVLIPARCEQYLNRTVADVLEHSSTATEVIVVFDGQYPAEPLPQDPRVKVLFVPESIGQRAATNAAAKLSESQFICKLDAHCSVSQGWDVELMRTAEELGQFVVQIPAQHNLHAFDRVCPCGRREYQGPVTVPCVSCGETNWTKEMVWKPRKGVLTTAWRFDKDLKFQYWNDFKKRPEGKGEITDTMSCLGACWFLDRQWYWELGGLDEAHGSWGNMGVEIACKAWLSGGRMVTNHRTTYAHMFRTQGRDFGFPYPISFYEQEAAREHSRKLWMNNAWPGQKYSLRWLVERFWPVPGWEQADVDQLPGLANAA
jgi:glycosyltransferase involved in cell wall biosynthesis